MGMLYRRGPVFWVKYYINGRPIRESTHTDKETEAKRFLKEREGRAATGQPVIPRIDRIRYDEIAEDLRRHYETSGERDLKEADARLKRLRAFFTGRRVANINATDAERYVQARQADGVGNSTINLELAMLMKMLRCAYERGKLLRLPVIHKLKEPAPRQGFFEPEPFHAVRRRLPEDLQVAVSIAYTYGWRMQSEILSLELAQVNIEAGTLELYAGRTKNGEGRLVYLTPELKALLIAQVRRVKQLSRTLNRVIPYLFPHLDERHKGEQIRDFTKCWKSACRETGVPGMLRHDLRRTSVRNLVNAGIPERVAMKATGHKTRSVFDRYHIVSPGDLQEAARKLTGTISGTIAQVSLDSRP